MLSRLASYLLRGAASGADDGEAPPRDEEVGAAPDGVASIPVEARLRQVEVEGDDWILIDRNVEGFAGMDESWYVTPPACFTQPGPVHVETSPLEDLLIEHPSMSVYRAAGSSSHSDKPESGKQRGKRRPPVPEAKKPVDNARLPLASRNANLQAVSTTTTTTTQATSLVRAEGQASSRSKAKANNNNSNSSSKHNRPSHYHHHHRHHHQNQGGAVAEQAPRRSSIRDLRNARGDENVRIEQIRSAQKMLEKRTSQTSKRNRLERGNKAREVSSGKGRRPRRQDRLRLNNSGANNNRKC
ncbi:basic-leucine zipper transcription factor A [Nasonia vitripennis]|uniref:Tumor protein p53-inducible nuclear protein 2 n=1 Tax=Nasonia vitripennis TaxID=7425 RepID=A0A7M7QEH7_NASVI|nr:basic-leucine zipper transcription factor A [Nasonia vitripennis]